MINHAAQHSRSIREAILRLVYNTFQANPDVRVLARHVYEMAMCQRIQILREEIDAELVYLVDIRMIDVANVPGMGPVPEKGYRLVPRGRDFYMAGCPWAKVDEFGEEQGGA